MRPVLALSRRGGAGGFSQAQAIKWGPGLPGGTATPDLSLFRPEREPGNLKKLGSMADDR